MRNFYRILTRKSKGKRNLRDLDTDARVFEGTGLVFWLRIGFGRRVVSMVMGICVP
jgi:hypothetical protein